MVSSDDSSTPRNSLEGSLRMLHDEKSNRLTNDIHGSGVNPLNDSRGLETVAPEILRRYLEPVMTEIQSICPNSILKLRRSSSTRGAIMQKGVYVEPIHRHIQPSHGNNVVRYLHLTDKPEKYSVGIFILPPHATIPLHDHPGMCVLSRVLYGQVDCTSVDIVPNGIQNPNLPFGTKVAKNKCCKRLTAPDTSLLLPHQGNLHEFTAGPKGAAILDILLPPYNSDHHRDCTFYYLSEVLQPDSASSAYKDMDYNSDVYHAIPTGIPEEFYCLSGTYEGIGHHIPGDDTDSDEDEYSDDDDDDMRIDAMDQH